MEQARTVEAAKLDLAPLEEDLGVDLQVQAVYADPRLQRNLVGEPELFRWFTVTTPEGMSSNDLTRHVRKSRDRLKVRRVQPDLPAGDPQVGDNGAPITQGHLEQWPRGLGVIPARERVDGAFEFGEGVGLIDIEQGWTFDHQELGLQAGAALLFGRVEPASRQHGTADLAIVRGLGGSRLRAGIAPAVGPVAAASHSGSVVNVAPAIAFAIDQLQCGDVLMLQVQTDESCQGPCGIPAEWLPVVAEQVERATRKGITIVAAAGNGGQALDDLRDENGIAVFDRTQRDTLAILFS